MNNGQLSEIWWTKMCNNIQSAGHHLLLGGLDACFFSANVFSSSFELSSAIKFNGCLIDYGIVDNILPRTINRIPLGGLQGGQAGHGR